MSNVSVLGLPEAVLPPVAPPNTSDTNCSVAEAGAADLADTMLLMHGVVIPAVAVVGVVLNTLNLVVLTHARLKESSYTYLTGLAATDLCMLLLFLVNGIGRGHFPAQTGWRVFEAYFYFPCGFVMTTAGALLTVTVSAERFVFIYRPLKARQWCTRKVARRVSVVIWLVCVTINIPRFFVFEVDYDRGALKYTDFGRSKASKYLSWFQFLFVSCSCGLALIILNILLIHGIHRTNHRRQTIFSKSTVHQRTDELRLTRTLISIVLVYLIGEIPSALTSRLLVVGLSGDECIAKTRGFKIASLVSTVLVVLQLSLNFLVYCVFNRRFWAVFKQQMCLCLVPNAKQGAGQDESLRLGNNNAACELSVLHPGPNLLHLGDRDQESTAPIVHNGYKH